MRMIGGKVIRTLTIVIPRDTYGAKSGSDFERMSLL